MYGVKLKDYRLEIITHQKNNIKYENDTAFIGSL